MRSLFARLFLSFILITLLAGIGTLAISSWTPIGPFGGMEKRLTVVRTANLSHLLSVTAQAAEKILAHGGRQKLLEFIQEAGNREQGQLYLLQEDLSTLTGRQPPPGAVKLAQAAQKTATLQHKVTKTHIIAAIPLKKNNQNTTLIASTVKELQTPALMGNRRKMHGFLLIAIMLVLAAPVCYLLARSLTEPIRDLRLATQRIARGDFSARVDLFASRSDEILNLSRDFNTMAKRTQSLLQSQKRLLRDISHELRSPLTRLNVALELARQHPQNSAAQLQRMEKESERLDELISNLLILAKKESQLDEIERKAIHIKELLQNIVQNATFEAGSKNIEIHIGAFKDFQVSGSTEVLGRALENVIRNGLHYSPPKSSIEINAEENNNQLTLCIRDYGPGVPKEQLTDIFKPFFRVTEARDRNSGGTGIGLAIAKRAVLMHGGSIEARNAKEGGLIVEISLPLL